MLSPLGGTYNIYYNIFNTRHNSGFCGLKVMCTYFSIMSAVCVSIASLFTHSSTYFLSLDYDGISESCCSISWDLPPTDVGFGIYTHTGLLVEKENSVVSGSTDQMCWFVNENWKRKVEHWVTPRTTVKPCLSNLPTCLPVIYPHRLFYLSPGRVSLWFSWWWAAWK